MRQQTFRPEILKTRHFRIFIVVFDDKLLFYDIMSTRQKTDKHNSNIYIFKILHQSIVTNDQVHLTNICPS